VTRQRAARWAIDAVLVLGGVLMLAPLVWLVANALAPDDVAFTLPPTWLPAPVSFDNFGQMFELIPFWRMAWNSLSIAAITTVGAVLVSALAAYAFARLHFRGRDAIFLVLLAALMVPPQVTAIPVFILMRSLHLVDSAPSVWLPGLINVFGIFFLRQYFLTIPRDLDEAALLDGAGHLRILFRIIMPLSAPALSALAIFVFEMSWNNFFWPNIFLSSQDQMTLPIGLVSLQAAVGGGPAVTVFAAVTMLVLPVLVLFLFFQRGLMQSLAQTGLRS
jgi:multiple sugar transport system permease protein